MLDVLQKSLHAIDKEFSLVSVEVLRPHELRARSEEHSFIINGKATYSYTTLPVESGVYPVSAICGTSYDTETMKITCLSPLDAYGLESIKKAIVTKKNGCLAMYKDSEKAIEAATQELRTGKIARFCGEFNKEAALVSNDEIMSLFAPERRCSVDRRAAYNHMRMENFQ